MRIRKIWNFGLLMHSSAYAVADKLAHNAVSGALRMVLYRRGYGRKLVPCDAHLQSLEKALFSDFDKLLYCGRSLADNESSRRVSVPSVQIRSNVDADYIAVLELILARYPMHHLLIHRCAYRGGVPVIVKKRRLRTVVAYELIGSLVQLLRRYARAHKLAHEL